MANSNAGAATTDTMHSNTEPERTRRGLIRLEGAMRRKRLRAHIYLVDETTTLNLVTTAKSEGADDQRILGPKEVAEALREIESLHGWSPTGQTCASQRRKERGSPGRCGTAHTWWSLE